MVKAGLLDDYDILIDEVLDVIETKGKKSKKSIDQFYLNDWLYGIRCKNWFSNTNK